MGGGINLLLKGAQRSGEWSRGVRVYVLVIMGAVSALAYMDRNILNVLLTPIKKEIGASDTAMGLLTGAAFAVFYATAAIPLARFVDFGNRRNLLTASLAVWSVATALCGAAGSYVQLLIARIGVAFGEAPSTPAIMSILADIYPPDRRATAIGVTLIGTGVGVMLGSVFGGLLAQHFGWRTAFVVVGLPGVIVAALMWLTVAEPMRGASEGGLKEDPDSETVWRTLRYLMGVPTVVLIALAKTCVQIGSQASLIWFPTFLIRVHGFTVGQTGLYYGVAIAAATTLAAVIGGPIADRLAGRSVVWYLRFCVLSMLLSGPISAALAFTPSAHLAVLFVFLYGFTSSLNTTPSMAAALAIVRPRMRGVMTAGVNFIFNVVGATAGGLIIGWLNDQLAPRFGDEAIRYSLLLMPAAIALAAIFYIAGCFTIVRDAKRAEFAEPAP